MLSNHWGPFLTLVVGQNRKRLMVGIDMAMITNIRHFMDENGEVPDLPLEAKELLSFLTAIIDSRNNRV